MAAELSTPAAGAPRASSYGAILKSSLLIGGSTLGTMTIGIVRTKIMALLLGPAGLGLMSAFSAIADLARTLSGVGLNSSGVRQIAEAAGIGDNRQLARTAGILVGLAVVLGLIGAMALSLMGDLIARLTFGSNEQASAVALLGLAVLLGLLNDANSARLQGTRRIADLAKAGVLGALVGTLAGVPLVYALGTAGVVPALAAMAGAAALSSWRYARRCGRSASLRELAATPLRGEVQSILTLGLAFMFSSALTMGAAYAVRMVLIRQHGLDAAGLYQAAWAISGLYVGILLQAMSSDFYPRLILAANDDTESNRLVNEQAQVSLLLAVCGVLATITFAPWILTLLYSGEFEGSTDVLRWLVLGMALRVVTWPVGYVLVARRKTALFVATDLIWALANVGMALLFVQRFGPVGAGIAFLCSYIVHLLVVYPFARRLTGFRWSPGNLRLMGGYVIMVSLVFAAFQTLNPAAAMACGAAAVAASTVYTLHALRDLVPRENLPAGLAWLSRAARNRP